MRSSLEEVARKASGILTNGDHFVRVKTWTGKKLHEARARGEDVSTDRGRAAAMLGIIQREKLWVPDPVGMEFITGPHLMACDKDEDNPEGVCVQAEDCDGKTALLVACYLSIGLHTVICAHGYDQEHPRERRLQHVIAKVKAGGEWFYADPSYEEFGFGTCHPFTRERVLSIPDGRVICDGEVCSAEVSGFDPDEDIFARGSGEYIGVNGVRTWRIEWLGAPQQQQQQGDAGEQGAAAAWQEAENRNFGTSEEDLKAYGRTAGAVAGAAACCAAGGVGCAAAAVCGYVGGLYGEQVVGGIISFFSKSEAHGVASNDVNDWGKAFWSGERETGFEMFCLGVVSAIRGKPAQYNPTMLKAQDPALSVTMGKLTKWPFKILPKPKPGEAWSAWVKRLGSFANSYTGGVLGKAEAQKRLENAAKEYEAAMVVGAANILGDQAADKAQNADTSGGGGGSGAGKVVVAAGIGALLWLFL